MRWKVSISRWFCWYQAGDLISPHVIPARYCWPRIGGYPWCSQRVLSTSWDDTVVTAAMLILKVKRRFQRPQLARTQHIELNHRHIHNYSCVFLCVRVQNEMTTARFSNQTDHQQTRARTHVARKNCAQRWKLRWRWWYCWGCSSTIIWNFYFSFCVCAARVLKAAHFLLWAISWNCVCTRNAAAHSLAHDVHTRIITI